MMRLTLLMLLVGAISGCGDKAKSNSAPAPDKTAEPKANAAPPADKAPADTTPAKRPERPTLLAMGAPVPEFSAKAHTGATISNKSLLGKPAVLYFYPKDFTPG